MNLTIIIPTLNSTTNKARRDNINRSLRECLQSLKETVPEVPIIVASNGGDPKPLPIEVGDNVKRLNIWEQGQCRAVNAAVAMTNTEWILVSNDDMVYPPGWLDWFGDQPCQSPKLVEPIQGAPTFAYYHCGGAGGDFDKEKFLDFVVMRQKRATEGKSWQPGFNLPFLIKREVWDLVEGYDINYDPWSSNSDSDLLYKLKLAGINPIQNQNCLVYHFSQTSGTQHPENKKYWDQNWKYFIDKWGFARINSPFIWTTDFEIDYKNLKYRPKWAILPGVERTRDNLTHDN